MDNTAGSLTSNEISVIIGSLLGDGYMRIIPGRNNAFLEINHSIKAKEYVDFKFNMLKRIVISKPKARKIDNVRIAYRFYTRQHPQLSILYKEFYKNGRKIIPKNLKLNSFIMAIWYMDDGSKSRSSDIYLNTQQFSLTDQKRLLFLLREYNISARINKDKKYNRIRIKKDSIVDFMNIIKPYVIPSMYYKLV